MTRLIDSMANISMGKRRMSELIAKAESMGASRASLIRKAWDRWLADCWMNGSPIPPRGRRRRVKLPDPPITRTTVSFGKERIQQILLVCQREEVSQAEAVRRAWDYWYSI